MKPEYRNMLAARQAVRRKFKADLYWLLTIQYPRLIERGRPYAQWAYTDMPTERARMPQDRV